MTSTMAERWTSTETSVAGRERTGPHNVQFRRSSAVATSHEVLPASGSARDVAFVPPWLPDVARRIIELSRRRDGWDSYGARGLQEGAVEPVIRLLVDLGSVIQSPPSVSLTVDGGLVCEWNSGGASLEFTSSPTGESRIYYCEELSGREWEGPAAESVWLEKWLWKASSVV
jgi:hypothetical protein